MELIKKTISECFDLRVQKTPDAIAIESEEHSYTWRELDAVSDYMAVRMYRLGIRKQDHAGIWSTNTPNWIITFLALVKLGAVPALLNTCYCEQELIEVTCYADVKYLFYGDRYKTQEYAPVVALMKSREKNRIEQFISIGRTESGGWYTESSFTDEEKSAESRKVVFDCKAAVRDTDLAALLFTSGTTSRAKGVMLSHYNLVNSSLETCEHMKWGEGDKMLIAVPLFHCFGITSSLLSSIHTGFTMHLIEYYKTIKVLEAAQNYRCTLLNGVPSMFLALLRNPARAEYDISSLRRGILAGSAISYEDYMALRKAIPNLKLHSSYGQTETSPCVSIGDVEDTDDENAKATGRVVKNCHVRIVDLSTGAVLKDGETGEIQVKGYNVMMGYYNLPEETKNAMTSDGWLHTGDLGYLDTRDFLYVTGRIKELIIRGGENISPNEIENAISQFPGIAQVKVIGLPVEVLQEMIVACIVTDSPDYEEEKLKSFLKERLAYYKLPSYFLRFSQIPMNASGKVLLKEVKEQAAGMIAQTRQAEK